MVLAQLTHRDIQQLNRLKTICTDEQLLKIIEMFTTEIKKRAIKNPNSVVFCGDYV